MFTRSTLSRRQLIELVGMSVSLGILDFSHLRAEGA